MIVKNNKKIEILENYKIEPLRAHDYKIEPLSIHDIDLTLDNIDKLIDEFELDASYISRSEAGFNHLFNNTKFFYYLDRIIVYLKTIKKIFMNIEKDMIKDLNRDLDIIKSSYK